MPVALPAAFLAVGLASVSRGLIVGDTWSGLVAGREIALHGLPSSERLTTLASGHDWIDQQWLGQLTLYLAAKAGGVGFAVALCIAAVVAAFGLAALTALQRGASPLAILAFFIAAFAAAPWGFQARTQALALPLFALTLWLVLRDRDARRASTLWALAILCLWANVHGSVVLGATVVFAYGFQALVRTGWHWRPLTLLLLAPATVFVSPYGARLPAYYRLMFFDSPFGQQIQEWQRTTPSLVTGVFFALAATAGALLLIRRSRATMLDCLVLAIPFCAALSAIRGIPWFGLAALAVLPALATRSTPPPPVRGARGRDSHRARSTSNGRRCRLGICTSA